MDDDRACHIDSFNVGEVASLFTEVPRRICILGRSRIALARRIGAKVLPAGDHDRPSDSRRPQIVGGLSVLMVLVNGMAILATWLLPTSFVLGPIEITALIVGVTSMLAARYLPDDLPGKARRRHSR